METTRLPAAERPLAAEPTSGSARLSDDAAAFSDVLRREHQRFLAAVSEATARLGRGDRALARTSALQQQLTRQFLDAQRSILLRHAETQAEIERIEREAEADASTQLALARRRAAAMSAHPAGGERSPLPSAPAVRPSESAPAADPGAMAEIVDLVFQPNEPEGAMARRQLTAMLDGWWKAEQQEARAKIDDASARAAMRRHVAALEAAAVDISSEVAPPAPLGTAPFGTAPGASVALPTRMYDILDAAAPARLDDVLAELLASLEAPAAVDPMATPTDWTAVAPLADGAIIRFEPTPVIAANGSDEAFQQFWTKDPVSPPARRTRWWQHIAVIVPATAVSSLVVAVLAWVG